MTTFVDFTPSRVAAFQFQAQLDGANYNVVVTWSLFGRRYYINVYALDGTLVLSTPMVGSPAGVQLERLSWAHGQATAVASVPHSFAVDSLVQVTVSGCSPDGYNGSVLAQVVDDMTLTYPVASDPGQATALGSVVYNVNLVAGYFDGSSLVYRAPSNQFEISP